MQVQTVWKEGSERHDWRVFLLQTCVTVAVLLAGGALVCWVAANWSAWSRLQRLAGAQAALVAVTVPAIYLLWRTRHQVARARSITSGLIGLACVALGALLALVGQVYQSGADTWELFALWAALMLPWAVAARSASVWMLWAVVVNTALVLLRGPLEVAPQWALLHAAPVWMVVFNLAALACWTACATGNQAQRRAGPRLLAALALAAATVALFEGDDVAQAGVLLWVWTAVPLALIYRQARVDGVVLALVVLSALAVAVRLIWSPGFEQAWEVSLLLGILLTLAAGVLGHRWIGQALRQPHARSDASAMHSRPLAWSLAAAALASALIGLATIWPTAHGTTPSTLIAVVALLALAAWVILTRRAIARPDWAGPARQAGLTQERVADTQDVTAPPAPTVQPDDTAESPALARPQAASLAQAALLALTAWIAAALLLGLLLLLAFDHAESVITLAGPGLVVLSAILVRAGARSLFLRQMASALAFTGLLLVTAETLAFGPVVSALDTLRLIAFSLAIYFISGYATMQFLASLTLAFGLVLASWIIPATPVDIGLAMSALFNGTGAHALGAWTPASFGLAALAVVLFLSSGAAGRSIRPFGDDPAWVQPNPEASSHGAGAPGWLQRFDPLPMAWGMALAALAIAWVSAGVPVTQFGNLWALHPPTALILASGALLPALACIGAMWPVRDGLTARMRWGVPLGLVALGVLWLPSPGILFALCWILLGFGLRRRALLSLGSLSLILYLGGYYYQLSVPLLEKARWLGLAGLVAAGLALLLWRAHARATSGVRGPAQLAGGHPDAVTTAGARRHAGWRAALALAGMLLVLGVANTTIVQRERLIAQGREVLLALAPVDPRSLMQGDYMRLDFVLARDIAQQIAAAPASAPAGDGYAIVTLLPNNEARLMRLQSDVHGLGPDELALRYRNDGDIRIVTNAWFFEEGQAEHFARSRYGVLRVDAQGRALLVEMRDDAFKPL